jgi:hypothetical protein
VYAVPTPDVFADQDGELARLEEAAKGGEKDARITLLKALQVRRVPCQHGCDRSALLCQVSTGEPYQGWCDRAAFGMPYQHWCAPCQHWCARSALVCFKGSIGVTCQHCCALGHVGMIPLTMEFVMCIKKFSERSPL